MSAREDLARAQAELVRALGAGGPVPEGFDAERVRAAAHSLLSKRRRGVQRAWPVLVKALGETFAETFNAWARVNPLQGVEPDARVDGHLFAEASRAEGRLPPEAEEEPWDFGLRWRLTREGALVARRGLGWKVGRVRGQWTLGVRLPGGRVLRW